MTKDIFDFQHEPYMEVAADAVSRMLIEMFLPKHYELRPASTKEGSWHEEVVNGIETIVYERQFGVGLYQIGLFIRNAPLEVSQIQKAFQVCTWEICQGMLAWCGAIAFEHHTNIVLPLKALRYMWGRKYAISMATFRKVLPLVRMRTSIDGEWVSLWDVPQDASVGSPGRPVLRASVTQAWSTMLKESRYGDSVIKVPAMVFEQRGYREHHGRLLAAMCETPALTGAVVLSRVLGKVYGRDHVKKLRGHHASATRLCELVEETFEMWEQSGGWVERLHTRQTSTVGAVLTGMVWYGRGKRPAGGVKW